MRKPLIVPALALAIAAATIGFAFASNDGARVDAPRDQWMTIAQITEKFTSQGYDVRKVKAGKHGYEIRATDKDGKRVETHVDPVTGAPLKGEMDD
jgi:hypothetical protein